MSEQRAPTIGLALIARDEEETLPHLLGSIEGAFDQVALLDTGSRDRTVEVFREWAEAERGRNPSFTYRVEHFEWCDDFAAARTAADALLETDWLCWADCDDVIKGARNLRRLVAEAPTGINAYVATYNYAQDAHGNCVCTLLRERVVRRGAGRWEGRVHEAQVVEGAMAQLTPDVAEWVHRKPPDQMASSKRNLRILRKWVRSEPENPRVLGYLGAEELARGRHKQAMRYFRRYLRLKTGWDEERAQVHRRLGIALIHEGRHEQAIETAFEAMRLLPEWPDSYLTLAEAHHQLGEWVKAASWARRVLEMGVPNSALILNPLDYSFAPRLVLASALGGMGRIDEAIQVAEEALAIVPDHEELNRAYAGWQGQRKREATAATFVAAARQLIAHDEQLKALKLLEETVPHYAQDHPDVVAMRSHVRERVRPLLDPEAYADHYEHGGSKPEDFIPDERVMELGDALPRCGFLLEGLLEQAGVAT